MKRLFLLLFALLLVAGVAIVTDASSVFAQDNNEDNGEHEFDPTTDNWCTNPDKWGDGRCNVEGDIWLTNWYYICGYYMARVESGEYPKGLAGQLVDDGCLVNIPPVPAPVITVRHHDGSFCVEVIIWLMCVTGNQVSFDNLPVDGVIDFLYLIISPSKSCPSGFVDNGTVVDFQDPIKVILTGLGFASTEKVCLAI